MIDIEELRALAGNIDNYKITKHMKKRFYDRNIRLEFIQEALLYGEIIEQYPDDFPYPSCLVLSYLGGEAPIHVCVGLESGKLWIITAYYPNTDEWEDDFKTRKVVN